MSFNEQEGTCSCTLRRSSITQDIAREISTTTAYSIGFVVKNPRERGGEKPRENQEKKLEKAKGGYGRAGVRKKGVKNFGAIWGARAECLESQKGGRFRFAYPNPSLGLAKLCYDMLCHVFKNAMVPEMPCFQEGHVMVSNLPTISDAILWRAGAADCEIKLPLVEPIHISSGLVYNLIMMAFKEGLKVRYSSKQPSAMVDTGWKGMAGQIVKCGKSSCYAFCSL
ncbi:hypothetical protein TIFTF001_033544 [Ficus carica]|uniref:Uncharacterized protein n=1 Tax=Ficus carica TaxID=3494 RepID=A0AA88E285_FICCA|nr:hypothetical protein TIFTF001_033544 [Ficus carica]